MDPLARKSHRRLPRRGWVPASTYYFLSTAISVCVFFLLWAILLDAKEESPWIPAGLVASSILIALGAVREIFLRNHRNRMLLEQRRLDRAVLAIPAVRHGTDPDKLTLERNAAFLHEIQRKSDAAKVLSSIPASHREVFELCEDYLAILERELPTVAAGSPRLRPLTKGKEFAARFHRHHMLRWAEGEAASFARSAAGSTDSGQSLSKAAETLAALELASRHYPEIAKLAESAAAVRELMVPLKVRALIEKAKNARSEGRSTHAESFLEEAEAILSEASVSVPDANPALGRLEQEIAEIRKDPHHLPRTGV